MTVDFSGLVPGLALEVDRSAGVPLGHQVQDALRGAIRSGRLRSGERLPSTRQLADELGVSRGLVVSAYEQLLAEGYVVATVGSGTRVADGVTESAGFTLSDAAEVDPAPRVPAPTIDFGYGVPDLRAFSRRDWLWALGDAIRTMRNVDLGDGAVEGDGQLRAVLAAYHQRVRAGCVDPAHTVVVAGFRQGLTFVLSALVAHGIERIGLEDPGPRDHDHIARRAGLRVSAVPVDGDGVRVDHLRASGARAVLLTPAHQCPTGAVLSPTRRHELVQWAHEVDGVILEDDYDAEFRYDRQPVGSLQGLAPERVVALGSVSKTLAPALRIGWVFTPPRFRDGILTEKRLSCRGVPQLDQAALARLIQTGRFDRHLRKVRDSYRQRRDTLVSAVTESMAGATITGLDAGHHVLLRLPSGVDEEQLVAHARAAGVGVRGLGDYRVTPDDEAPRDPLHPALVIGFGNVTIRQIREGIGVLGRLVAARS
ncbi:GntR family transcriptional regulator / MocR family aminotransferase [Micromonospora citrea]|uniref:GntR family transcriptional regulator / MocR family aminotransferase n=1 Tax=Micromonospora citrea TaxID=47855 RepID=A0A1C6U5Y8_9ACTN|nr:PLP-dependent aminotransferase family protein [Micromonospora citrea]SCL49363.1 GntR family transcriptional regulator / MocR family aminotransferase [Micromonospora citrea]